MTFAKSMVINILLNFYLVKNNFYKFPNSIIRNEK